VEEEFGRKGGKSIDLRRPDISSGVREEWCGLALALLLGCVSIFESD